MVRIAIVEDDRESAEVLKGHLHRYEKEHGQSFEISVYTDGDEILSAVDASFDIIFLDIQMKRVDGLSAARKIREVDKAVILIFITNMAQYAIHGYQVDALSYLLKPVPYFAFSQELKRCLERLEKRMSSYMMLPVERGLTRVNVAEVYYIESNRHTLIVHTSNGDYVFTGALKDMETQLEGANFFRCNNCYLVNLAHVERVIQHTAVVGGHSLLISRPRKKAFLAALTDYVGGVVK